MLEGSPRILVVRLSAIGDVVRVLPAMHALRDFFPRARIDWVVERKSAAILERHPCLDRVIVFERQDGLLINARAFGGLLYDIRRARYDIVIDFHGILKSGLISFVSGARERYGFSRPRGQEGSWLAANKRVKLPSNDMNRVDENLALIEPLAPSPRNKNFSIYIPPDAYEGVEAYFDEQFAGGKMVVGLHAPVDRPEKQWPLHRYAELCDMLLSDGRFEVLLTYGPDQRTVAEEVASLTKRKPLLAPETADLKDYAWLIQHCDLYVGGDTGPMHIAAAVGTPVVALFGGTDPRKHSPQGAPCTVVAPGAGSDAASLAEIDAETVYDACVQMLRHRSEMRILHQAQATVSEGGEADES